MEKKGIKKRWIILIVILVPFLPQVPGCIMANTPKFGRVVDASTGKGMPNVTVIAAATFFAGPILHGSSHDTPYRIMTQTNALGYYWIPSTWQHPALGLPGTEPREIWLVTAFKPGYGIVGDDEAWSSFDEYGAPKRWPRSVVRSPSAWWLGWIVKVDPIVLRPVEFSLKQAAVYYRALTLIGGGVYYPNEPQEVALRRQAYNALLPRVCTVDANVEIDYATLEGLSSIIPNESEFFKQMKHLEPNMWGKEIYARPKYQATNVCDGMKAGGETP